MNYDHYASLEDQGACPQPSLEGNLSPELSDGCTHLFYRSQGYNMNLVSPWRCNYKPYSRRPDPKNDSRNCYMNRAKNFKIAFPDGLVRIDSKHSYFEPDFSKIPFKNAIGIEVHFSLLTPWFSKDDRRFHVLDNPVHKDWVFGVPYIPAASWKGMLRWSCRMEDGLLDHFKKNGVTMKGWKELPWILHLFGNEKKETTDFLQGALRFLPTFFKSVDFEVINPHSRETKAGTKPIYYEVVPKMAAGVLRIVYAPARPKNSMSLSECKLWMNKLINAIDNLLGKYGISAKRTAGWGRAGSSSGS